MKILLPIFSFALGWLCAYQPEPPRVYLADLVVDGHAVWCFSPGLSIERGFEAAAHPHTVSDQAVMDLSDVRPPGGQPE